MSSKYLQQGPKINEVFPNPKGKDQGKEWIELYNPSLKDLILENWKISNGKESPIPKIRIKAQSHAIIYPQISLKNKNETLQLLDQQNNIIHQISYKKPPEGKSYSHSTIRNGHQQKNTWFWTNPSKNNANPLFYEISGIITAAPTITADFSFQINNQTKIIIPQEKFPLIQNLLQEGQKISILGQQQSPTIYLLEEFTIHNQIKTNPTTPKQNWENYLLIPIVFLTIILIIIKKRRRT